MVDLWNSILESVVESPSIKTFENHVDKHWKKLPIKYKYLAQPKPLHAMKHYILSNNELALKGLAARRGSSKQFISYVTYGIALCYLCLCETFLTEDINDSEILISGFQLYNVTVC